MNIHSDFRDFIVSLQKNRVDFMIVGAFALALHGHPRATGDIDIWIQPDEENAGRLIDSLTS